MVYTRKKQRSPDLDAVMARIEEVRKSRGMTQNAFAAKIGVPPQSYSNYVTGQFSDPRVGLLIGIRREFGISADWLLGADGPPAGLGARA